jgi:hypothetical protein
MARGDVVIRIRADYTDKDLNRAQRDIDSLRRNAQQTAPAMAGLGRGFAAAGAALAGMVGLQEITRFMQDSAKAAIDDEKSMRSLAKAMENVGLKAALPEIETGIGRMSRMFGIADDQLRPAFQQLALATEDAAQSQKLLSVALDISAGTGRDLESVTLALAKASSGQTTALQRLGVGLDASILKSRDMDAITAELSRKFGGQAAAAADTYGGKMARLSVAVDEAKEAIGRGLLDALDRMTASLGGTDGAISFIDELGVTLGEAARGFGIAGAEVIDFRNNIFGAIPGLNRFKLSLVDTLLLGVNPLILALAQLGRTSDLPGIGVPSKGTGGLKPNRPSAFIPGLMDPVGDTGTSGSVPGTAYGLRTSGFGGGAAVDQVIGAEMQRRLGVASQILRNQSTPALADASIQVAQAMFAKFADQRGPAADQVRGLFDQAFSVLGEKIEAARQIGQQVADGLTGQLSLATALETAKQTGQSIVDAFIDQGAKVKAFAANLQKLMTAGLSKQAFDEIVSLGYQRGADVADALLTGNVQENVRRANEVYTSVNSIAVQTGNQAAAAFGQVGIQMAIDMMQALIDALTGKKGKAYRTLQEAMDALAASLYRKTFIDVETRNIGGGGGAAAPSAPAFDRPLPPISASALGQYAPQGPNLGPNIPSGEGRIYAELVAMNTYRRAAGGPVMGGQPYIVGEIGPELFIPGQSGSIVPNHALGGGATYNITVQAGVGDPREIGRQVVEAIKSFERASGPVFVNA